MSENPMVDALAVQVPLPAVTSRGCGFSCWQYHGSRGWGGCRNSIEFDETVSFEEAETRAGMAGWCIGHFDGQAHITCPDDRESVWDASPLGYDVNVIEAIAEIARFFAPATADL